MKQKKSPSKKRKLVRRNVHALNIVINPHPDGRYIELFRTALSNKTTFSFFGTRTGVITSFRKESGSARLYKGTMALFSDINFDRSWLDFSTGDAAQVEDLESIRIPKNLRPEFKAIPFVFDVVKHRMIFVSNGLGVSSARKLIEGLFRESGSLRETDDLEVTVIQDEDNLDKMLAERGIRELTIEINLPNADSLRDAEQELYDRLRKQNAKSLFQQIVADSSGDLKPDDELRTLGKIALENGSVKTRVHTADGAVTRSTDEFPKMRRLFFDPLSSTEFDALINIYKEFA
jgi:hypothetical protein